MKKNSPARFAAAIALFALFAVNPLTGHTLPPARQYYEIRIYHMANHQQEQTLDQYIKEALLPGLHRAGIRQAGVFKPIGNDTSSSPSIYLLIPYASLQEMEAVDKKLTNDKQYFAAAGDYLNASHDNAPYQRIEKILLQAFTGMPALKAPALSAPRNERVYELRSYESSTEKLNIAKVKMFNAGSEIDIFQRLGFNTVFCAEVLAGSTMPNLMYMTSFNSLDSRNAHWKSFMSDPAWVKLSAEKEYANTVSKHNIFLLSPTEYSDF